MQIGSLVRATCPIAPSPTLSRVPRDSTPICWLATTSSSAFASSKISSSPPLTPSSGVARRSTEWGGPATRAPAAGEHGLEELAQLELAGEVGQGLQHRLLLVGAAALRVEQARAAQGDARLGRGGGEDFEVVLAEGVLPVALHHQHAEDPVAGPERHVPLRAAVEAGPITRFPGP